MATEKQSVEQHEEDKAQKLAVLRRAEELLRAGWVTGVYRSDVEITESVLRFKTVDTFEAVDAEHKPCYCLVGALWAAEDELRARAEGHLSLEDCAVLDWLAREKFPSEPHFWSRIDSLVVLNDKLRELPQGGSAPDTVLDVIRDAIQALQA